MWHMSIKNNLCTSHFHSSCDYWSLHTYQQSTQERYDWQQLCVKKQYSVRYIEILCGRLNSTATQSVCCRSSNTLFTYTRRWLHLGTIPKLAVKESPKLKTNSPDCDRSRDEILKFDFTDVNDMLINCMFSIDEWLIACCLLRLILSKGRSAPMPKIPTLKTRMRFLQRSAAIALIGKTRYTQRIHCHIEHSQHKSTETSIIDEKIK